MRKTSLFHMRSVTGKSWNISTKDKTEGENPSSFNLCVSVADSRTFMEDYRKVVEFCEWLKKKAEG